MRMISPSELTDFTFCQKYWFNKRKLGLVSKKIDHRDLAAMMGQSVGWYMDQVFKGVESRNAIVYFYSLLDEAKANGRTYGYGIDEKTIEKVEYKIADHIDTLMTYEQDWLQGGTVIASEPVMNEWGQARQDIVIEGPAGEGIIGDFKCKYSDKKKSFAVSRDIDLYGNQKELYPLAWNSTNHPLVITKMRFIYSVEGARPIVEDVLVNPKRQVRWLQQYNNVVEQIHNLELTPTTICDKIIENPYHITPWGYECEFRTYCMSGEHDQGALVEFIQIERKAKQHGPL